MDNQFEVKMEGYIETPAIRKSKWVKDLRTRMRVFNTQIFQNVYEGHAKDNAEMNYQFMTKTFNKLKEKAAVDDDITEFEYIQFDEQYNINFGKLLTKTLKKTEKVPWTL